MNEQQQPIEVTINEARTAVELGEAIERLLKNEDYITVIENGYLRDNVLKMAPHVSSPHEALSKGAVNAIIGVGAYKSYIRAAAMEGESAKAALVEHESVRLQQLGAEE